MPLKYVLIFHITLQIYLRLSELLTYIYCSWIISLSKYTTQVSGLVQLLPQLLRQFFRNQAQISIRPRSVPDPSPIIGSD